LSVPTEPKKFLDPEPISDNVPVDVSKLSDDTAQQIGDDLRAMQDEGLNLVSNPAPCADCTRYAQAGYVIGACVGIAAGGLVAYVILRNRLAPIG
jgi:hypothetical protein